MKCAEIHPNLTAFVLGGLEPEEAAEVERHLASCPGCRRELEELRKVNRALEAAPPPVDPPSHLKDVILARVRAERLSASDKEEPEESSFLEEQTGSSGTSRFNRSKHLRIFLPSMAAAAVVVMVALGVFFGFLRDEPTVATIQLVPTPQEAAGLNGSSYWGVAEIRPQPSGNQQVELKLNNFEEPKPRSYYELWFVSAEKKRMISAGSFTSVGEGQTTVLLNVPPEARNYHTLLITEERIDKGPALSKEVALKGEAP
jgi:anti-sigma-K factor RskA